MAHSNVTTTDKFDSQKKCLNMSVLVKGTQQVELYRHASEIPHVLNKHTGFFKCQLGRTNITKHVISTGRFCSCKATTQSHLLKKYRVNLKIWQKRRLSDLHSSFSCLRFNEQWRGMNMCRLCTIE